MSKTDGFEANNKFRRREGDSRHTPITATTALALEGERVKTGCCRTDDYIGRAGQAGKADTDAQAVAVSVKINQVVDYLRVKQ